MLTQAASLAVLSAISPTALLVSAVFLGSAEPRSTIVMYLSGATLVTVVMATVVYLVLRAGHLYRPDEHQARYDLRLGLGVLLLAFGVYFLRRAKKVRGPAKQRQGLISRMIARPAPKTAFIVGVLVYSPSLTFVAAVSAVATASESVKASVVALLLVVVITLVFVWVPLVLYLLAPEQTARLLASVDRWLRAHGKLLLAVAMIAGGALLAVSGILGVTGVVS
jgi:hypothetical protein